MNLAKVKLNVWVIDTSPVHHLEATDPSLKEWTLDKAKAGKFFSQYDLPLVVHCAKEMPPDGEWRKIGLDRDVSPFSKRWYDVKVSTPAELGWSADDKKFFLDACKRALYHWPVHIHFMELVPSIEVKIFIKSMDIIQKFRKDVEKHAYSGRETCCNIARARNLVKKISTKTGDELNQAADILKKSWANTIDVKI